MFQQKQIRRKIEKQSLLRPVMVLLLCFMILFSSCYVKPVKVEAAATTVAVAGAVTVAAAIAALGIGVSGAMNTPAYNKACQNIWDGMSSAVQKGAIWVSGAAGQIHANLSSAFLHAVAGGMVAAYPPNSQWGDSISFSSLLSHLGWDNSLLSQSSWNYGWYSQLKPNTYTNWNLIAETTISANTNYSVGDLIVHINSSGIVSFQGGQNSEEDSFHDSLVTGTPLVIGSQVAILAAQYNTTWYYFFLVNSTRANGICVYPSTGAGVAPSVPDVYNPADKSLYADGYSVMNHKVDDVIGRIGALQGIQAGINVQLGDYAGTLAQINDAIKALTQAQVTSVDATDAAEKAADDTVNKGRDTTAPKNPTMPDMTIPRMITRKFPFSIPWDLYNSIANLVSPGEAPIWKIPFKNEKLGFDYSVTLDMSQYNTLAALMRWGLSLLFLMGLILVTNKLIKH